MFGKPTRHQENGVDANVIAWSGITSGKALGSYRHAPKPILVQRHGRRIFTVPLLDFDECDGPSALGNQIDFTPRNTRAASQNSPAMKAQPPGGDRLGPAPPCFGDLPIQSEPPRSSARE